jgi:hypothetical protein
MNTMTRITVGTLFAAVLACGGDGGGGTGPSGLAASTTYTGVVTATDGLTAGLTLTFASAVASRGALPQQAGLAAAAAAAVPATGVVTLPGGGTVDLSGTLDNNTLTMSGGGYTLTGALSSGKFTGTFTGPGASGVFTALASSNVTPAYAYCGSYASIITPGNIEENGTFNAVVAGTVLSGVSVSSLGDIVPFTGTASPGTQGTTNISVNQTNAQGTIKGTGTITADYSTISGQYQASVVGEQATANGTFQGTLCPGTAPAIAVR